MWGKLRKIYNFKTDVTVRRAGEKLARTYHKAVELTGLSRGFDKKLTEN